MPLLQWISIGWLRASRMVDKAPTILSSGIETNGSLLPGMPNWKSLRRGRKRREGAVEGKEREGEKGEGEER